MITWIEKTYHRRRRQRVLGKLTPIEFETIQPGRSRGLKTINPRCQPKWGQSRWDPPATHAHTAISYSSRWDVTLSAVRQARCSASRSSGTAKGLPINNHSI